MKKTRVIALVVLAGALGATSFVNCTDGTTATPGATPDAAANNNDGAGLTDSAIIDTPDTGGDFDSATPDDSGTTDSAAPGTDAGTDTGVADTGAVDSACTPTDMTYANCTAADYVDVGAADQGIDFGGSGTSVGLTYKPKCLKIKANQTVTWNGTFSAHPLSPASCNPAAGGTIPTTDTGPASVKFTQPGFYGYFCQFHVGVGMAGVIQVY